MKTRLRIASVIMFLHAIAHTIGALTWKNAENPDMQRVVDGMVSTRQDFMGRAITLGSFFDGYGFVMIGVLLLVSILLWLGPGRRTTLLLSLFLLYLGICELAWFFPLAAAFSLAAGIISLYTYFKTEHSWKPSN